MGSRTQRDNKALAKAVCVASEHATFRRSSKALACSASADIACSAAILLSNTNWCPHQLPHPAAVLSTTAVQLYCVLNLVSCILPGWAGQAWGWVTQSMMGDFNLARLTCHGSSIFYSFLQKIFYVLNLDLPER